MPGMTLKSPDETVFYPDIQVWIGGRYVTPNWTPSLRTLLRIGEPLIGADQTYYDLIRAGF